MFPLPSTFALVFVFPVNALPDGRVRRAKTGQESVCTLTAQTKKTITMTTLNVDVKKLAALVSADVVITSKEVLTSEEAARYMGVSLSYLYKLTAAREIPHYKPRGKMCYFNRRELEEWLKGNRVSTGKEIDGRARAYCMEKGGEL